MGLWLWVLVHACAHKPAAKPRRARTSFSAAANVDGTVLKVTAAIHKFMIAAQDAAEDVGQDVAQDVVKDLVHTTSGGAAQSASIFIMTDY